MWRRHFLEHNDAKYLPKGWSVDHRMESHFGKLSKYSMDNQGDQPEQYEVIKAEAEEAS